MNNSLFCNLTKSKDLIGLPDGELKMLFFVCIYLGQKDKNVFANNVETREYARSLGFSRTPVGFSNLLSGLVEKGFLIREAKGVFSLKKDLFYFS